MQEILEANPGPFFVNISKRTGSHLARLRLPLGCQGPPPLVERIESESPDSEPIESVATEPAEPLRLEAPDEPKDLSKAKPGNLFR
jgi:hypothetical protein